MSRPPPPQAFDLEITILSAKHLKNVNWRKGDLKPYATFWLDHNDRFSTKPDDSGSTRPVWNEHFIVSIPSSLQESILNVEVLHSNPSETLKPLVGAIQFPLRDLIDLDDTNSMFIRNIELRRPSGRPQGKIRVKLAVRERQLPPISPAYHVNHQLGFYPPSSHRPNFYPARDYREFSPYGSHPPPSIAPLPYSYPPYADPSYYRGYYPQPPMRPSFDRTASGYPSPSVPSAPFDYSAYDQRFKDGKPDLGTGSVAGALGGLSLEDGRKFEEGKVHSEISGRDNYSTHPGDY